jgi:hypothetical protein
MPNPQFGTFNRPGSLFQLQRGRGANSDLVGFLLPLAMRDYVFLDYDFENATISPDWAVSNSSGTSAADFASTDTVENGVLRGDTGTDDNGSIEIHYGKVMFDAARNPGSEIGLAFDVVTSMAFEFAFADPPSTASTLNVSALSAAGAPTIASNGVTDQFGIVRNTDLTATTACVYSKGTTDAAAGGLLGTFIPVAATYSTYRIQGGDGFAYAIIDDNQAQSAGLSLGPDTGILMRPHLIVATKVASTAKFPDLDYARIWAERSY